MAVQFVVTNQAVDINGEVYGYPNNPNGTTIYIPCEQTEIVGSYWRIPQVQGGRLIGYQYATDLGGSIPPTPDSVKVLCVKFTNDAGITTVFLVIANTDNTATASPQNQLAYLCDGLGGTLPVMPEITIPFPVLQNGPQNAPGATSNTFVFSFPQNPNGLLYTMNAAYFNGAAATPAYSPAGITTTAGFVTWANTHWSAYGVWSALSTSTVQLVSPPSSPNTQTTKAGLITVLTPVNYCFNLTAFSTPASVNQVQFGTGPLQSVPAFLLTNNNITLMNVLLKVTSSGTVYNTAVANKLGLLTTQATPQLYNNGVTVVTTGAGTC